MQTYEGDDIWEMVGIAWIVIPTNIGYKAKPKGKGAKFWNVGPNVMGRGLARDAAERYPWIPQHYGEYCWLKSVDASVVYDLKSRLVFFPVKPLDEEKPWQSCGAQPTFCTDRSWITTLLSVSQKNWRKRACPNTTPQRMGKPRPESRPPKP